MKIVSHSIWNNPKPVFLDSDDLSNEFIYSCSGQLALGTNVKASKLSIPGQSWWPEFWLCLDRCVVVTQSSPLLFWLDVAGECVGQAWWPRTSWFCDQSLWFWPEHHHRPCSDPCQLQARHVLLHGPRGLWVVEWMISHGWWLHYAQLSEYLNDKNGYLMVTR